MNKSLEESFGESVYETLNIATIVSNVSLDMKFQKGFINCRVACMKEYIMVVANDI